MRRQEWVTRPIRPWDHKTLDIYWLQKPWLDNGKYAHALIWSVDPVYCAASVYMREDTFYISTAGWYGMSASDRESLEAYLQDLAKEYFQ